MTRSFRDPFGNVSDFTSNDYRAARELDSFLLIRYPIIRYLLQLLLCIEQSSVSVSSVYPGLYSQLSCIQLIILLESPEDGSIYQYIRPCLERVLSITPFN